VQTFVVSATELGANLHEKYRQYIPEDPSEDPKTAALAFRSAEFGSSEAVLSATRAMLAQELATEPSVRSTLRMTAWSQAGVNIVPTDRGRAEIDASHPFYVRASIL
jgi:transcription elongation factor SPT6